MPDLSKTQPPPLGLGLKVEWGKSNAYQTDHLIYWCYDKPLKYHKLFPGSTQDALEKGNSKAQLSSTKKSLFDEITPYVFETDLKLGDEWQVRPEVLAAAIQHFYPMSVASDHSWPWLLPSLYLDFILPILFDMLTTAAATAVLMVPMCSTLTADLSMATTHCVTVGHPHPHSPPTLSHSTTTFHHAIHHLLLQSKRRSLPHVPFTGHSHHCYSQYAWLRFGYGHCPPLH